ncbi:MAG: permease [Phycisphaerales bacterium]|nr:permease [Phycisphaerales bacterium]
MERREWTKLIALVALFVGVYLLPIGDASVERAVGEGLRLTQWYAREHVILCLLPAFLIAGAIAAFVDKAAVMKYLGPKAAKPAAYGVGATSGCILAVCSCTVLPLFAGIYRMGAGLGPAMAFLYAGPAINVLAVILTARVLGVEIGLARALGAIVFSLVIGLVMASIFERGGTNADKADVVAVAPDAGEARPLHQLVALFGLMIAVLIFANWAGSPDATGLWHFMAANKWPLTIGSALPLAFVLWRWFGFPMLGLIGAGWLVGALAFLLPHEPVVAFAGAIVALCLMMPRAGEQGREWWAQTWGYAKLITPLLIGGVFVAGLLLGTPESRGLVPPEWVERAVGGNGVGANLGASIVGAFMYFATLTEVPILEGLIGSGMGKGPALALLLAGPALSLPSMLVIREVLGTKKTIAYVTVVIVGSTAAGLIYGLISG